MAVLFLDSLSGILTGGRQLFRGRRFSTTLPLVVEGDSFPIFFLVDGRETHQPLAIEVRANCVLLELRV